MMPEKQTVMHNSEQVAAKKAGNPYFEPAYVKGRHDILDRFKEWRERIENKDLPKAEKDWEVIWALTGPDETLEKDAKIHAGEEHKATEYNQTRRRFETALEVAREVTAVRLEKNVSEVTSADIAEQGPIVYWNGKASTNDYLLKLIESGKFEEEFHFPPSRIRISQNRDVQHTNHQLVDFPADMLSTSGKAVIISDIYHLPRVEENLRGHPEKFTTGNTVLFPSLPSEFPSGQFRNVHREIRNIPLYKERGMFSEKEIKPPKKE